MKYIIYRFKKLSKPQIELIQNKQKTRCMIANCWDLPGGAVVKSPPANAGDMGLIPGRENLTCRGATKPVHHNY